uniref:Complement factor H n=1 Tax=Astyanax mexicanus TaxID=7994 RepID=A0A3B1KE14_ASTMX
MHVTKTLQFRLQSKFTHEVIRCKQDQNVLTFLLCLPDCQRNDIPFTKILKSALKTSYSSGSIVRVNCETGHVGLLKLSCQNGTWTKEGGRECKKKPCGHPGDTPNGDFELVGDTEFVFGARVEYTCRTGYIMASRVNTRICRTQGWDNTIPICEVVRCPPIETPEFVIASGNTEDASYDDVINFECSNNLMLTGPKDIHCKEDGTWSAPVPKCKAIECKPPKLLHGEIIELKSIYKENEVLKYECEKTHKKRQGIPKCLRNGWSITPQCEEIHCSLGPATIGIERTNPEGKNLFKAEESVEVICAKNYWLSVVKKTSGWIKCKDDGHWESPPACEDIGCEIPYDQHVYWPEYTFSADRRLGVTKSYSCQSGYKRAAKMAECTMDGWIPNPLCIEKGCLAPTIENTKPLTNPKHKYKLYESVQYQCLPGYEPERFSITCNWNEQWDNMKSCTAKQGTLLPCNSFRFTHGFMHYLESDPQWVSYSCDQGYKPIEEGWWGQKSCRQGFVDSKPQCIRSDSCVGLPKIPHAKPSQTDKVFENGAWGNLNCDCGFRINPYHIQCVEGQWKPLPQCERMCGHPPRVENAVVLYIDRQEWDRVTYRCRDGFTMKGPETIYCSNSDWRTTPRCELDTNTCGRPTDEINNATIKDTSNVEDYYLYVNTVEYKCSEGFKFKRTKFARCSQGNWIYPTCIPSTPSNPDREEDVSQPDRESSTVRATDTPEESPRTGACGSPSPIKDAVQEFKDKYEDGEKATYECPAYYVKDGDPHLTCRQGRWRGKGECLEPCTVDVHDMDPRNIQLQIGDRRKMYSRHGDHITFKCQKRYKHDGLVPLRQICQNGQMNLPRCV